MSHATPAPAAGRDALTAILSDLQHLSEANETTRLLARQAPAPLAAALLRRLDNIEALVGALIVKAGGR
ncbi:MAG: hypothetical protein AB7O98_09455 [Hyphomonadaceae bacterium]